MRPATDGPHTSLPRHRAETFTWGRQAPQGATHVRRGGPRPPPSGLRMAGFRLERGTLALGLPLSWSGFRGRKPHSPHGCHIKSTRTGPQSWGLPE